MAGNDEIEKVIAGVEVIDRFCNNIATVYKVAELVECPMLSCRLLGIEVLPNNLKKGTSGEN